MSSQPFCEAVPVVVSVDWDQATAEDEAAHVVALAGTDQAMALSVCVPVSSVHARVRAQLCTLTTQGYSIHDRLSHLILPRFGRVPKAEIY